MSGSESGRIGHGQTAEEVVSFVKAEVVMAVLHGEVVAAEIARQHGVHETLVYKWKRQFLEAGKQSFEDQRTANAKEVQLEKEVERLKTLLGEKVVELDVAKKARGL